ncbi:hypothetical protein ABTM19_20860, partial [Acinetobacter baumannii]
MTAINPRGLDVAARLALCEAAQATATKLGHNYLQSLISTTMAGIYVETGDYRQGLDLFLANIAELEADASQRGRKYLASML